MFLYFHIKYNIILFVLEIFDYIQIKTLFLLFFFTFTEKNTHTFFFIIIMFSHIYMLPITKIQHKTNNTSHK